MINKKKLVSSPSMRKQYFVANNLFGEGGSMQLTVMSEGLLLNAKCIIGSRGGGGGRVQAFLTQLPRVIVCHELIRFGGYPFTALPWSEMSLQYFMSCQLGN